MRAVAAYRRQYSGTNRAGVEKKGLHACNIKTSF